MPEEELNLMHSKPAIPRNQWNWAESIKTIAADISRYSFAFLLMVTAVDGGGESSVLQQRWRYFVTARYH